METINLPEGVQIKLQVAISSDALVATNIRIGNTIISSKQYKFTKNLGNISELENSKMTIGANFYVSDNNINQIMNATQVIFKILYDGESQELSIQKKKRTDDFFTVYAYVKFTKS